jgi:hypothetical protein
MRRFLQRPNRSRSVDQPGAGERKCSARPLMPDSPLCSELRAMLDHAERLGWLAEREYRPADYQYAAQHAITALLIGWQQQCDAGSLADLLPAAHAAIVAPCGAEPGGIGDA